MSDLGVRDLFQLRISDPFEVVSEPPIPTVEMALPLIRFVGALVTTTFEWGNSFVWDRTAQFMAAGERGDEAAVRALLRSGSRIEERGKCFVFYHAARNGNLALMEVLFLHGYLVTGEILWRAILFAGEKGHSVVVERLLTLDDSLQDREEERGEATLSAVEQGHHPVVKVLLRNGAKIPKSHRERSFSFAVAANFIEIAQEIWANNQRMVDEDQMGKEYLDEVQRIALSRGHSQILAILGSSPA